MFGVKCRDESLKVRRDSTEEHAHDRKNEEIPPLDVRNNGINDNLQ
jgi:hypothetical protein